MSLWGPLLFKPQGVTVSEGEFMAVSVGAGREAWRWSSSQEYTSYLQVATIGTGLNLLKPQSLPSVTHLLQQDYTS